MNDMIKQMVQPLLDAFDMYPASNPAIQKEVEEFKAKLTAFAEGQSDVMAYYTEFANSGLQTEYTDLISKVAVLNTAQSQADAPEDSDANSSAPSITVRDFLEQYRPAYDELCKRDSVRGRKAYEELFAVAERTDDMLEAQLIIEKERLLWRIVKDDALEILENKLSQMDPLFLSTTAVLIGQINAYNTANSEEELTYLLGVQEREDWKVIAEYICKMNIAAMLAKELVEYIKAKEMVYDWYNERGAHTGVATMYSKRENLRTIISFMKEFLGMETEDLFSDPGTAIWMLSPQNLDEYGRKRKVCSAKNFEIFRDVLENEIQASISIKEALLR